MKTHNKLSRRLFLTLAAGLCVTASLPAAATTVQAEPRVLKFSDHEPLGGMRTKFLKEVVFPAIERESNGRLRIEDHWNGEIAEAYDALGAVSTSGKTDIATVVPEYTAKELPLHQIFKGFLKGPAGGDQVDFYKQVYSQVSAFSAELDKNNIVPIFFGTGYPVAFYSTEPITDLEALKGGKWRSASFWHLDYLRNVGATPVTMHWGPEVPAALKDGTLDGLMVNVDSGYMLKVHEAAPNVLVSRDLWLGHLYLLAINKGVWDSLAPEDKHAIQRAAASSYAQLGAVMDASYAAQLEDLKKAGATVRELSENEVDQFVTGSKSPEVRTAWALKQKAEGVADAETVLGQVSAIMDTTLR